jgi:hypothetical protein
MRSMSASDVPPNFMTRRAMDKAKQFPGKTGYSLAAGVAGGNLWPQCVARVEMG